LVVIPDDDAGNFVVATVADTDLVVSEPNRGIRVPYALVLARLSAPFFRVLLGDVS
jgi:hypothetical protein